MKLRYLPIFFLILFTANLKAESKKLLSAIDNAIPSVVFVANEFNSFDEYFDPDPDSYVEYLRPFYEFLWPPLYSHGSGFIISPEGHVVTNAHVVEDATYTFVSLVEHEVRIVKAEVLGIDRRTDLAVLKIMSEDEKHCFPYLEFGDSDSTQIGEEIAIVGNPLSSVLESTVTTGVLSGRDRRGFGVQQIEEFLQTDASINPGNSGGPMINDQGEVIGVVFGGFTYFEGLKFLIPSQIAKKIVAQLIDHGEVSAGYLGVCIEDDREMIFDAFTFHRNQGAVVEVVQPDSPAEAAGIEVGDRIVSINNHQIRSAGILIGQLAITPPNDLVILHVIRDGEELEFAIFLEE